jgi:isomerase DpgB
MSDYESSPKPGVLIKIELAADSVISSRMIDDINLACDRAQDAGPGSVLAVRLAPGKKEGALFPAGGHSELHMLSQWERALQRIEKLPIPTLAVVEGDCFGLMMEILLTTDFRIAGADSRIGLTRMGQTLWPSMAIHRLVAQIGGAHARAAVLLGMEWDAAAALGVGLINKVSNDVDACADAHVRFCEQATFADLGIRRRLLLEATSTTHDQALGAHLAACDRALRATAV